MSTAQKDLAASRIEKLREILRRERIVGVAALSRALGVSGATVRRDLRLLAARGEVRRVHGGAMTAQQPVPEPVFDDKTALAAAEKRRIAAAALNLIGPRETLYLDGGSTVLALAVLLKERTDLTVVTNSLRVLTELASGGPALIVVSGELRRLSQTFVGPLSRFTLEQLHVDKAFMGTIGVEARAGLTTTDPREAYTKALVMEHARQVIVLADSSKLGQVSFARAGGLERVNMLITDRRASRRALRDFVKRGIKVLTV